MRGRHTSTQGMERGAADALVPYCLEHEVESWWYGQYVLNLVAAALFGISLNPNPKP
jgi:hypothetical protein